MKAQEIKLEFERLSAVFNSKDKDVNRYEVGHRLSGLSTRHHKITGVWLNKPPRR